MTQQRRKRRSTAWATINVRAEAKARLEAIESATGMTRERMFELILCLGERWVADNDPSRGRGESATAEAAEADAGAESTPA